MEFNILEKVIGALKETIVLGEDNEETDAVIEHLDSEFDEIASQVHMYIEPSLSSIMQKIVVGLSVVIK